MDKKAKDILFKTYWGAQGWKSNAVTAPADFAYAKSKGLMFDRVNLDHDQCVNDLLALRERIPLEKAARGFLSSLSSRRLDWRSGLASLHAALDMEDHRYDPEVSGHSYGPDGRIIHTAYSCRYCRSFSGSSVPGDKVFEKDINLNVLNFERIKWGGVRHGDLIYAWFDLQQLEKEDVPEPGPEDPAIFEAILATIATSAPNDTPGTLEKRLTPVLKSSKSERQVLIEILAYVGVLEARVERPWRGDWNHAGAWRGEDRYDGDAVKHLLGNWLASPL